MWLKIRPRQGETLVRLLVLTRATCYALLDTDEQITEAFLVSSAWIRSLFEERVTVMKFLLQPINLISFLISWIVVLFLLFCGPNGIRDLHKKAEAVQLEMRGLQKDNAELGQKIVKLEIEVALANKGCLGSNVYNVYAVRNYKPQIGPVRDGYKFFATNKQGELLVGWYDKTKEIEVSLVETNNCW